jgi:hypothetical protein
MEAEMSGFGRDYGFAMAQFDKHISRASDGTFVLNAVDGPSIGVDNPVAFEDLRRSLEVTNEKIRRGELDPAEII